MPRGRSAAMEATLTIAPRPALRSIAGIANLEARNMLSTLTCMTRRHVAASSSTTLPRLAMPTLLSRKSSLPKRSSAASIIARHCASSVTSAHHGAALPPSAAIIATVRSASARSRSTTSTFVPERANKIAAARPLPIPSPAAPAPVTMAALPAKPAASAIVLGSMLTVAAYATCVRCS
jgi:hypothetical protein